MKLYSYFRSSAAYRVRIALNLKNLSYDIIPISLLKSEHKSKNYLSKNASGLIPSLELDDGRVISQSMAILDFLENVYPETSLLPKDSIDRAIVLSMCQIITCDTHPLNNLRVLQYLTKELNINENQKQNWYTHWIHHNFNGLENLLDMHSGNFCFGDTVTWADICLIPQVYNANRFKVSLKDFPNILRVAKNCNRIESFVRAAPEHQPDNI